VIDVVVPFRASGKTRLPTQLRAELAHAMLCDVVVAASGVGRVLVVTDDLAGVPEGARAVADPGGGQSAAVGAALLLVRGPTLVVNADLPCATPDALLRLAGRRPALVAAEDGTTNALSLPDPTLFAPLYGPGSAARFAAAGLVPVSIPELELDVDTVSDLDALSLPLGRRTELVLSRHELVPARV
jgi:2-phospho-L-lactate guanylyltransferase (CobY/MobA/RfbA family)